MKIAKQFLALCLSLVLVCSTLLFPHANAEETEPQDISVSTVEEYEQMVETQAQKNSTVGFYRFLRTIRFLFRALTGQLIFPDRNFDVTLDETLSEYCAYICENSGLDIPRILTSLPDSSKPAELITKVFGIDTAEMRDEMYAKRDALYDEGDPVKAEIYHLIGAYFSIMDKCEITAVPTEEANVCQVQLLVTFRDGSTEVLYPGIFINSVTGEAYNRDGQGLIDLGFNCSIYDLLVYTPVNVWMRQFGFCFFYDFFCYTSPDWMWDYTTRRFKFDYDGKEWMIQAWKGHYLCTNGGEIGIYNRDKSKIGSYYDCVSDEEMLEMTMTVSHAGEELFTVGPKMHWWITGFKIGPTLYDPESLTMNGSIVMKDEAMLTAFCAAIDHNYRHDVTYRVDGLTVYLDW